ncbi:GH36-type glycosyl hydrolase domain-containing protein [Rubrivivax gelatinosus]|uniref:GH36-type glycosyl hydrolase domain-containing protein n=1 Tax=Rubrivivax gelatinosus TaxID=28068 RepID=UPI001F5B7E01|nr:glucoamylase family protein [Rubrivivax gelatinosus]
MAGDDAPLRAELLTADEMEQLGLRLASEHRVATSRGRDELLDRLADNEAALAQTCALLSGRADAAQRATPAGEWLLDNWYLIGEEILTARRHLPPGYSRELPRLIDGPHQGLPRVYALTLLAVAHTDGRLDRGVLMRFVSSYQTVQPLQLGELWAVPIMLRLALIENLRRVAAGVARSLLERETAGRWVDRLTEVARREPGDLILVVADMARSRPPLTPPFVAELSRRVHGGAPALALALNWVEQRLTEQGATVDSLVKAEAQGQAAAQVAVSNSIAGLRLLDATDWRDFVEAQSVVERTLQADPPGVYRRMDFATRDHYRHEVERIARHADADEQQVAEAALRLARAAAALPQSHVGWWLRDAGRPELERAVAMRLPWPLRARRAFARHPLAAYGGSVVAVTAVVMAAVIALATQGFALAPAGAAWTAAALLALLLVASQFAVVVVNAIAMRGVAPDALPRLDYADGIPAEDRTLVVVPTMLADAAGADALLEALEVRHLANRDPQLLFALLTDFSDAAQEHLPGDEALLAHARRGIEALNARYAGAPFLLLHRPRLWNPREGAWIGRERKRGKLADLNRLLRDGAPGCFSLVVGDVARLPGVRYVVTLDTDTQLPRDAARQFVATMAHPLNRPRIGGRQGAPCVVAGYGILQPRVGTTLVGAGQTRYGRLFGGEPGIDPYTGAVSDIYQDLFGEGSFIGKGIYDVDTVEAVLRDRLPDDRVLSHDLLEGGYARSGLLSDVELAEAPPARYDVDARRRHRWIRGDWQIAAWALPWVPVPDTRPGRTGRTRRVANPLSLLTRVKILDNLRRSLVAAAMVALLLLGWLLLPQPALWTAAVLAVLLAPTVLGLLNDLLRRPGPAGLGEQGRAAAESAWRHLRQAVVTLAVLPHEAHYSLDAVARTLWRLHVSRRLLLQWQPSSELGRDRTSDAWAALAQAALRLAAGPLLAVLVHQALAVWRPEVLPLATPLLLAWFVSPFIVWWVDLPLPPSIDTLDDAGRGELRLLARRTWAFFETYVGPADHHLPPDNVQLQPVARLARRTSPTNIGLSLLATLAAHDFGWVGDAELLERTAATLDTLDRMERHRGHWLNWYDTETLQPLRPAYVSTVDSGNLAGHLLTLRAGLLELAAAPPRPLRLLHGLADPLRLLQQAVDGTPQALPVQRFAAQWEAALTRATEGTALRASLAELAATAQALADAAPPGAADGTLLDTSSPPDEAERWARALQRQCAAALAEVDTLATLGSGAGWDLAAMALRRTAAQQLARRAESMAAMDFRFLYDEERDLLTIGFNVDDRRRDVGHYDLLASEARLGTFVAIAAGELPQRAWFALGRQVSTLGGRSVLLSWSGSMFEYLMPMLVMPNYDETLLGQTMRGAVERQIRHGRLRGVPWGISESGYNTTDAQLNYQYRAFGVPGLGLRRGLDADLVVAPYASVMAVMVEPRAALQNIRRLAAEGLAGAFGLHEAVDYTPSRLPPGERRAIVRSYMAHHQGMSLLALAYVLLDQPMQRRFESDPSLQATLLLLQERVPRTGPTVPPVAEPPQARAGEPEGQLPARVFTTVQTPHPEVQLLSNGRYHVMLTHAGSGYSRWNGTALTRWREDGTADAWGSFCYLRDTETGIVWSATPQPTRWTPERFEAVFTEGRAEFRRRDQGIDVYTEVVVSPEDDFELRRMRLTNRSRSRRSIELTTYSEVVLAPPAADAAHPAFGKLFVQTELLEHPPAIVCTRRPRSAEERPPSMFHLVTVHGTQAGEVSHETDRARFIGRGRSLQAPAALQASGPLSGTAGAVLDPVVATRRVVTLEPGQTVVVDIVYGAADSREACVALALKAADRRLADRAFELAWTHSQVLLRQINTSEASAQTYARLANAVVFSQPTWRPGGATLLQNRRGQAGLWGYAISGDLPIVLLQIGDAANLDLVRRLIQAHAWWRLKGLAVDLVVWNEERDVYRQQLHDQIVSLIASSIESHIVERPGGIFVRHAEQIAVEDRVLLQAVARAVISDRRGSLEQQLVAPRTRAHFPPPLAATRPVDRPSAATVAAELAEACAGLVQFNGSGGFSPDGREYVVVTCGQRRPPAPWVNVIANPRFGTVVSEAGGAYTWCENAHELRLTPWHNDPVTDPSGEAFYLRDEESGQVWSPLSEPAPAIGGEAPDAPPYRARHGFGYSAFEHRRAGVHSTLTVFVAPDDALKFSRIVLRNEGNRTRRLSVTGYVEWVLGDQREKTAPHVATEVSAEHGALYARNRYGNDFGDWVGFLDVDPAERVGGSVTGDRAEFIGRNHSLRRPAALRRTTLSGRSGAGLDPCGAIQVIVELAPGQVREVVFRLGMGRSTDEADRLVLANRGNARAAAVFDAVRAHWNELLGAVQLHTPSPTLDLLANGWLMYQTVACRLWARSGYYQSGGAFGFRDQLQDAMATVHARPELLREQLLRCAGRQFAEGDVQHWWHPPAGRGVRTRISDDYLWLPLALARYVGATHDSGVLEEEVGFLDAPPVLPPDESRYDLPGRAAGTASVYEHARRAIEHGLSFGEHGLPLMGAGDWNDGMNRVGEHGRGESVWLGFFLCEVLRAFAPLARRCGDTAFAARCEAERDALAVRLEDAGWDGGWYRRAYFDDGTPLGTHDAVECRIDSISQSWAVLSGVAGPARARQAMDAVQTHLVHADTGIVQLLEPPFDRRGPNPGYIAGYVPGVRENGGQYTHGAIWVAMAWAALGEAERAWAIVELINPLHHGGDAEQVGVYKVEPYVMAADVYSIAPHGGRGGWTWYTGSAGWMYRLIVESILGLTLQVDERGAHLDLRPCIPASWPGFTLDYRRHETRYRIVVTRGSQPGLAIDGQPLPGISLPLVDDGQLHEAVLTLGP